MGVKGLQYFMEKCCPETCVMVDFREMARQHVNSHQQGSSTTLPTLVVDGMACLRHWYSCQAWVYGGQWKEYMHCLKEFVGAFTTAGIRLVFFFDGVVEEEKRAEWVKRRLKVNEEVARVFHYLKCHGQQPGRGLFCLPSGLATFSRFALKSLGQETWCSVREADYEIASFALRHNCMGILGQDTDFIIYGSVPYLSVAQLRIDSMTTVLFSTDKLCHALQLQKSELPLLACLLGNDVVPEQRMQRLRSDALAAYRRKHPQSPPQGEKIYAVADFISSNKLSREGAHGVSCLPLTDREVLEKGIQYYLLPGQQPLWDISDTSPHSPVCLMKSYLSPDILQAAKEKHMRAECFMVYNVLYDGVVECSNTLEDREDAELTPQAIVYQPCRERIYGILLPTNTDRGGQAPTVREWFVFPGNPLKDPKVVSPLPLNHSVGKADLKALWFGKDSETKCLRISTFLAVFELDEFSVEHDRLDGSLMAVLCLVTYIAMQVVHLSLEDIDAYLSQAICVRYKSYTELLHTRFALAEAVFEWVAGGRQVSGMMCLAGPNQPSYRLWEGPGLSCGATGGSAGLSVCPRADPPGGRQQRLRMPLLHGAADALEHLRRPALPLKVPAGSLREATGGAAGGQCILGVPVPFSERAGPGNLQQAWPDHPVQTTDNTSREACG
uniref:Family with sequence similarity 120 member B n=1 Tax=Hucho hucho TaxID=62062 RepID=A0A4W5RY58_9TELE